MSKVECRKSSAEARLPKASGPRPSALDSRRTAGFTLVEIAISLAVIGIALVAIIGVLPLGMNVQRDNREATIINQDATVFIEAISKGARGLDDLTNYVYAITNYWTLFNSSGVAIRSNYNAYTYGKVYVTSGVYPSAPYSSQPITNGATIVGLMSTPELVADAYNFPETNYPAASGLLYVPQRYGNAFGCYSNHVFAYVRAVSGGATEKPPQDNEIIQADAFAYRLLCVNAPMPVDTNSFFIPVNQQAYNRQMSANLHELRLTFQWPIRPNGNIGVGRQTYRTLVAGLVEPKIIFNAGNFLYFYQPQSFTNAP